jgi:mono/diheme cytochrome c family protein
MFIQHTVNAEDGSSLHAENCIACHASMTGGDGSVLYTREDHSVKSVDDLRKQVNRCQSSLGLNWSDEQISSVQQYLNTSFYKF